MSENTNMNTNQNIITAIAIIVALVAVVYALMVNIEKPSAGNEKITLTQTSSQAFEVGENNPVVMSVNGTDVTRAQVLQNFIESGSQLPQDADMAQVFPLLQEQYVVGELLEQAAKDKGIDQSNPKVQQRLNDVLGQALRAVYIEEIGEEGITDEDIQKAYDDIATTSKDTMERRARHILVADEGAANALIIKLKNGADFAKLAEENSTGPTSKNGGDLGYFAKGEMVPAFSDAAFSMDIGAVSNKPVQTQFGFHVIKVEDERKREMPAFNEVKDQLAGQLRQAVVREEMQKLRENSEITLYDMNGNELPKATEADATADTEATTETEAVTDPEPVDAQ